MNYGKSTFVTFVGMGECGEVDTPLGMRGGEVLPGSWLISPPKYCPEILGLNCNTDDNDGRIIQ